MPVSMEFLRGVLGLFGIGAAYMTGRTVIAVQRGWHKPSRLYGWILRTAVCLLAVMLRNPFDRTDLIVWFLAAAFFALGLYQTTRLKPADDLTRAMFPEDEDRESGN